MQNIRPLPSCISPAISHLIFCPLHVFCSRYIRLWHSKQMDKWSIITADGCCDSSFFCFSSTHSFSLWPSWFTFISLKDCRAQNYCWRCFYMLKQEEEQTFLNARETADLSDDSVCAKHNASLSMTSTCTHISLAVLDGALCSPNASLCMNRNTHTQKQFLNFLTS